MGECLSPHSKNSYMQSTNCKCWRTKEKVETVIPSQHLERCVSQGYPSDNNQGPKQYSCKKLENSTIIPCNEQLRIVHVHGIVFFLS